MAPSEVMAIVIFYHYSGFKCFKYFYCRGILHSWKDYFPQAVSYNRFIELKKEVNLALYFFIHWAGLGHQSGTYYVDSTKLPVCDNHRIHQHKVFKDVAKRGKTSMGWFYGLKLHVLINEQGGMMGFCFTSGNVSDNNVQVVGQLCKRLYTGKVFGDAGYVSQQLFEFLYQQGLTLLTKIRKNRKNKFMKMKDKYLLKKRTLIETVIDLLKSIFDLWNTRHRSINAFNNTLACLAAYGFMERKPSISQYSKRNAILSLLQLSN